MLTFVDIRIGIQNSARELAFESGQSAEQIESAVAQALTNASVLRLTDVKGAVYLVPSSALSYVEVGTEEARRVGFVA